MLEDELDVLSRDALVLFEVVALESDLQLLLEVADEAVAQEFDKFVVVDSFVSVGVDLIANSNAKSFWHVQVLDCPFEADVVLGAPGDESEVYAAQVWNQQLF